MTKTNPSNLPPSETDESRVEDYTHAEHSSYLRLQDRFRLRLSSTLACAWAHPEAIQDLQKIEAINAKADGFNIYETAHSGSIHPESALTFLPSPEPFPLPEEVRNMIEPYGIAISRYYLACRDLIRNFPEGHRWNKHLGHSKSKWMLEVENRERRVHPFLRPDLILTKDGPIVTEIESSPFGLALSIFLTNAYQDGDEDALGSSDDAIESIRKSMVSETDSSDGIYALMFTEHTQKYRGQLEYLAKQLSDLNVVVIQPDDIVDVDGQLFFGGKRINAIYRGFYLYEAMNNDKLQAILKNSSTTVSPPCLPQLEEKALMALLFDPELESYFREKIGEDYDLLRAIFPRTWVIDGEVPDDLPVDSWPAIANMSRKQRSFVIKPSGFSTDSSWAQGVHFLSRLSQAKCRDLIKSVLASDTIYVLQEFKRGLKFPHPYFDFHAETMKTMDGRVRLTPYYSSEDGSLLTIKATMCENTDYIHGMVSSINVAVK